MERIKWLVINYTLPTEPSRHRVAVWRYLRKLGAINIQQSMWLMPDNQENYAALQDISHDIESGKGESLIMESVFTDEKYEKKVISLFNSLRDEEYSELIRECDKYLNEIEKEIATAKFTFAELEEEEEELNKLISWYQKITVRDLFHSLVRKTAAEKLVQIKNAFENYSDSVYKNNEK